MKKKVPVVIQMHTGENAAATLTMMLGAFGKILPMSQVRNVCVSSRNGTSPQRFVKSAEAFGLKAEYREIRPEQLYAGVEDGSLQLPVVAGFRKKFYVIIRKIKKGQIHLTDASKGEYVITLEKFAQQYRGFLITLEPDEGFVPSGKPDTLLHVLYRRIRGYQKPIIRSALFPFGRTFFRFRHIPIFRMLTRIAAFQDLVGVVAILHAVRISVGKVIGGRFIVAGPFAEAFFLDEEFDFVGKELLDCIVGHLPDYGIKHILVTRTETSFDNSFTHFNLFVS